MPLKTLVIILDGLGDRCHQELDDKTPLEYAMTPNLDALAKKSETGLFHAMDPGICLNTDLAHLLMFGYSQDDYPGRAVIDLLGEGIKLQENQLALRTSWATVETDETYLLKERFTPQVTYDEAMILGEAISGTFEGYDFNWIFSHDSHGFLIVTGDGLCGSISDSDPFHTNQYVMKVEPFANDNRSTQCADLINRYLIHVATLLESHSTNKKRLKMGLLPVNMLLTKWAGKQKEVDCFERQNGMGGRLFAGSKLLKGLSEYIGLDFEMEKDFGIGITKALSLTDDFICVHTKEPDEAAHTKNPMEKVRVLEAIDKKLKPLLDIDLNQWLLIVASDHSTPSSGELIHSGEYVPILFYGKNVRPDNVSTFNERSCVLGTYRLSAKNLMPLILNYSDRANLYNLRHGNKHRLYKPVHVNPLKKI